MRVGTLAALLVLAACGTEAPMWVGGIPEDAEVMDTPDASESRPDAKTVSGRDSGTPDTGTLPDAAMPLDAATRPDAATPLDAATPPDAAMPPDAAVVDPCLTLNCDDHNPCTDDSCALGACVHKANAQTCDDGDACTTNDRCLNSICTGGVQPNCDDGNPCSHDACDRAAGCKHVNVPDGLVCGSITGLKCYSGQCQCVVGIQETCNDGIDNNCDGKVDCADPACNNQACDDHNPCTSGDTCQGTACVGTLKTCTQNTYRCNETNGTCNPATGACVFNILPVNAPCDADNSRCTPDVCSPGGICSNLSWRSNGQGGWYGDPIAPIACNDSNLCTLDTCEPATGLCKFQAAPNGMTCDVGVCRDGQCCTGCFSGGTCLSGRDINSCGKQGETCRVCPPPPALECRAAVAADCSKGYCTNAYTNLPNGTTCSAGMCIEGSCLNPSCGVIGKPACMQAGNPVTCATGVNAYVNSVDVCLASCGAFGGPCCGGKSPGTCNNGLALSCYPDHRCWLACGWTGGACCPDGTDVTIPEATLNSRQCRDSDDCQGGVCKNNNCGGKGEKCCARDTYDPYGELNVSGCNKKPLYWGEELKCSYKDSRFQCVY